MTPSLAFHHRAVPADDPAASPTLLLLHGTGGDENDLIPVGALLAAALPRGANLLSPRGKVSENGMPRFFRRFAEGVFDYGDIRARAAELAGFVGEACTQHAFDPRRVYAVGYSNGANIAAALLLLEPGVLAGAALFRAMVPVPEGYVPAAPQRVPVLIVNGRRDPIARPAETERLAALLAAAGAAVTLEWQPGGHELSPADLDAASSWFARTVA